MPRVGRFPYTMTQQTCVDWKREIHASGPVSSQGPALLSQARHLGLFMTSQESPPASSPTLSVFGIKLYEVVACGAKIHRLGNITASAQWEDFPRASPSSRVI